MKQKTSTLATWALMGLVLLAGCRPQAPNLSPGDEAAIYAAVIRQIYLVDDTYGGSLHSPTVYLVQGTDDSVGDPEVESAGSEMLAEPMLTEISNGLEDLPAEIIWVESRKDVPLDPDTGEVIGSGVIITLGNIHPQEDGSVHVSGSIFIAPLAAGGQTYQVEPVDGGLWKVGGTVGVQWIS